MILVNLEIVETKKFSNEEKLFRKDSRHNKVLWLPKQNVKMNELLTYLQNETLYPTNDMLIIPRRFRTSLLYS